MMAIIAAKYSNRACHGFKAAAAQVMALSAWWYFWKQSTMFLFGFGGFLTDANVERKGLWQTTEALPWEHLRSSAKVLSSTEGTHMQVLFAARLPDAVMIRPDSGRAISHAFHSNISPDPLQGPVHTEVLLRELSGSISLTVAPLVPKDSPGSCPVGAWSVSREGLSAVLSLPCPVLTLGNSSCPDMVHGHWDGIPLAAASLPLVLA